MGAMGQGPEAHGPPLGDTLSRGSQGGVIYSPLFPRWSSRDGPPTLWGSISRALLVIIVICTDFTDFSDFVVLEYSYTTIILYDYRFFSEIVLRRNYLINRVELFEEKSILVFPECLEACEW